MAQSRILCLGETHDHPDVHRWQAQVLEGLLALGLSPALCFEMLPREAQPMLEAWGRGELTYAEFLRRVRWNEVWGFDPELYRPLFELGRDRVLPMRALNVRRDLVRRVGREGWEAIPEARREGLSRPAPASPAYRRMLFGLTGGPRPDRGAMSPSDPAFDNFVRAQQVWDRAFAEGLIEARAMQGVSLAVGLIGRGHLENGLGVPEQLADLGETDVLVALVEPEQAPQAPGMADLVFTLGAG